MTDNVLHCIIVPVDTTTCICAELNGKDVEQKREIRYLDEDTLVVGEYVCPVHYEGL